jgi:hypothetical protein
MRAAWTLFSAVFFVSVAVGCATGQTVSPGLVDPAVGQGSPPGVHHETVAEYPSADPGIEKVLIRKFTLDPGAKEENFTPEFDNQCTGGQGEATIVAKDGTTYMHKAGTIWIERKGETQSIYNNGKVPYVDIFVTRIPKNHPDP